MAQYFGQGATSSAIEHQFRPIRKLANELKAEHASQTDGAPVTATADAVAAATATGMTARANGVARGMGTGTQELPKKIRARKPKVDGVISGRVTKATKAVATKTRGKETEDGDSLPNGHNASDAEKTIKSEGQSVKVEADEGELYGC